MRIFLSHSSADKSFVRQVKDALAPYVERSWFDEAEILPGDSLYKKIEMGIEESTRVLAFVSKNSIESKWVKKELDAFYGIEDEYEDVKVIPLILESVTPPPFIISRQRIEIINPDGELSSSSLSEILKAIYRTRAVLTIEIDVEKPFLLPSLTSELADFREEGRSGDLLFVIDHSALDRLCLPNLIDDDGGASERFGLAWPRVFSLFSMFATRLSAYVYQFYGKDIAAPAELNRLLALIWRLLCLSLLLIYRSYGDVAVLENYLPSVLDEFKSLNEFTSKHFHNRWVPYVDLLWQQHLDLPLDETYDLGFVGKESFFDAGHISVPKSAVFADWCPNSNDSSPELEFFGHKWIRQVLPVIIAKAIFEGAHSSRELCEIVRRTGVQTTEYRRFGIE
ncbi:MAG: toll/interleukin-1 receptor domain-containing protein [Elainellaceae cyanobacterium]